MARDGIDFSQFYPTCLDQHRDSSCRRLHFVAAASVLATVMYVLLTGRWLALLALPLLGFVLPWLGHLVFEGNRPRALRHPLLNLLGHIALFRDMLVGRIRL